MSETMNTYCAEVLLHAAVVFDARQVSCIAQVADVVMLPAVEL
ncbi:MAG: hypothetical protein NXH97_20040 [Rhodobacteraceae bacterium]|nr:hypothetical protein [Paracoccaceae bacterium]